MLRLPYRPPSPFLRWRAGLARRFVAAASQRGLTHPVVEYLREVASNTTPTRPYSLVERGCCSELLGDIYNWPCKVHPLHFAAHSAVWAIWSGTRRWPPWRVIGHLLQALSWEGGKKMLPDAARELVMDFVGEEFTEQRFLDPNRPFQVGPLDQWEWWWQLWRDQGPSTRG